MFTQSVLLTEKLLKYINRGKKGESLGGGGGILLRRIDLKMKGWW